MGFPFDSLGRTMWSFGKRGSIQKESEIPILHGDSIPKGEGLKEGSPWKRRPGSFYEWIGGCSGKGGTRNT